MGNLNFNLEDFQQAAITFRSVLLRLPLIGANATLQYMTLRPGVRYEELVGQISADAELAPYKAGKRSDANLDLKLRPLRTFFGALNADFEPNAVIQTLLGHKASQASGDALNTTITAKEVMAVVAKAVSAKLNMAIWSAKRDENGNTTDTLFNGFDTITKAEIEKGAIAEAEGNYLKIGEEITAVNAVDIAKEILHKMDDSLREEECYLFCTREFADKYNEGFQLTHGGIVYNQQYGQTAVEGSEGLLKIIPLASKKGSKFIHVSPKKNMLFGVDQVSDLEQVRVGSYSPDVITLMLRMFAGAQFESIDRRRLLVAEL